MKNNSLEEVFRQKLEDLRIEPSDKGKDLLYQKIRKRGRIILYRRLSIAAGIIFVLSAGYFYLRPDNGQHVVVQQEKSISGQDKTLKVEDLDIQQEEIAESRDQVLTREDDEPETNRGTGQTQDKSREFTINELAVTGTPAQEIPVQSIEGENPENRMDVVKTPETILPETIENQAGHANPMAATDPVQTDPETGEKNVRGEPVKITIEYIASGSGKSREDAGQNAVRELYSKINPDAVLGDIRTFKDQLLALDFINKRSPQNTNEK
jgi:hypothetical protein